MTWKINEKEFARVNSLPSAQRYAYLIKKVCDQEEVYSLKSSAGWVLIGDDDGREGVPIWPHARYAQACAAGEWADAMPEAIPLKNWMQRWRPGMEKDRRFVAAFPVFGEIKAGRLEPREHLEDLQKELEESYDE